MEVSGSLAEPGVLAARDDFSLLLDTDWGLKQTTDGDNPCCSERFPVILFGAFE